MTNSFSKLREQARKAAELILDAKAAECVPIGHDVDADHRFTEPAFGFVGDAGPRQVGAELDQAFDGRIVDFFEGVDDLFIGQMAIGRRAFALQVVVFDDVVAELAEDALHLGLYGFVVGLDDGDFLFDVVELERLAHAVDRECHADVASGPVYHAFPQVFDRRQGAAPDGQCRDTEDEIIRLAGHDPLDRAVEPCVDQLNALVETVVVRRRDVLDMHTAQVIGHAGRAHVVVFRLHHRIGRGRGHPHLGPISEIVDHCTHSP